ncbi:hypothetical protein GCM10009066_24740 [Halarchaeum salinum]|uniref:Uncharacterized protein n=1 Tax=Halarchaeum salinum TaxID=489912 RepID=A0AAV3SB23_9EURY
MNAFGRVPADSGTYNRVHQSSEQRFDARVSTPGDGGRDINQWVFVTSALATHGVSVPHVEMPYYQPLTP